MVGLFALVLGATYWGLIAFAFELALAFALALALTFEVAPAPAFAFAFAFAFAGLVVAVAGDLGVVVAELLGGMENRRRPWSACAGLRALALDLAVLEVEASIVVVVVVVVLAGAAGAACDGACLLSTNMARVSALWL